MAFALLSGIAGYIIQHEDCANWARPAARLPSSWSQLLRSRHTKSTKLANTYKYSCKHKAQSPDGGLLQCFNMLTNRQTDSLSADLKQRST